MKVERNIKKKNIRTQEQFTSNKKKKILKKKKLNEVFISTKEDKTITDQSQVIKEMKAPKFNKLSKHKKREKLKVAIFLIF
jgi:hypothetical protein